MVPSRKMNAYITSSTTGGQSIMDDRKEIEIHPPEDVDLPLDSKVEFNEEKCEYSSSDEIKDKLESGSNDSSEFVEMEKEVLDEMGADQFDVLPDGWTKMFHDIGIPMYVHKNSGVVTLARPHFLGSSDLIRHRLPLSAIPCLQYRKQMDKLHSNIKPSVRYIGKLAVPVVKVETVESYHKSKSSDHQQIYDYCKNIMPVVRKPSSSSEVWDGGKTDENLDGEYISSCLPSARKLIIFSILEKDNERKVIRRKEGVINPYGKGYVTVLHEFARQALQLQPFYKFDTLHSFSYESTVFLNNQRLGRGRGSSKKQAKMTAAKETLEILIPQLKGQTENMSKPTNFIRKNIFDDVKITDPKVPELLTKTCEPTPYSTLLTCLRRNYGFCGVKLNYKLNEEHTALNRYTIKFGTHKVTVNCRNKRSGKQKAAQAMLQILHPDLSTWGSIIRLYGSKSANKTREVKRIDREITRLQRRAKVNSPNYAVLNKLFEELKKLSVQNEQRKPPMLPFYEGEIPNFS